MKIPPDRRSSESHVVTGKNVQHWKIVVEQRGREGDAVDVRLVGEQQHRRLGLDDAPQPFQVFFADHHILVVGQRQDPVIEPCAQIDEQCTGVSDQLLQVTVGLLVHFLQRPSALG